MIILTTVAVTLAAIVGYFAYKNSKTTNQYLDEKAKYESVVNYSKTLEEQLKTTPKVAKSTKAIKVGEAPKKRGRKPAAK